MQLSFIDTSKLMAPTMHGRHDKDVMVLHETVSADIIGLSDIINVEKYLAQIGYGIHGMTDKEGNIAWAKGLGTGVFYHCGGVNERACGIEQVSLIPLLLEHKVITLEQAYERWRARDVQLHSTAKLVACWHNSDKANRPLKFSDGDHPGVTSHWNVSQHHPESEGHTDCWPHHLGGYFPILAVIRFAKVYADFDYHF
jgi:hypothetical protein